MTGFVTGQIRCQLRLHITLEQHHNQASNERGYQGPRGGGGRAAVGGLSWSQARRGLGGARGGWMRDDQSSAGLSGVVLMPCWHPYHGRIQGQAPPPPGMTIGGGGPPMVRDAIPYKITLFVTICKGYFRICWFSNIQSP